MKYKTIKIISDGKPHNTRVFDSDGNELGPVVAVEWSVNCADVPIAKITFCDVAIEAEVAAPKEIKLRTDLLLLDAIQTEEGRKAIVHAIKQARRDGELI